MNKLTTHLWFDKEAKEAAQFYVSAFGKGSKIHNISTIHHTPSGDVDIVSFELLGFPFQAISAGPLFKFNPSISFIVNFDPARDKDASNNIDKLWKTLSQGGSHLMPIQEYPFSKRFGWLADKFGLSWQLMLTSPEGDPRPDIIPFLMFVGNNLGKAEEAIKFYLSVFKDTKMGQIRRHQKGSEPEREGTIMFADFMITNTWFAAMDSAQEHKFAFNEAISFIVHCSDQKEIDYYWDKLSAVPESEQCGWLKDKFGLSWQIVPDVMDEMMAKGTKEQSARVTEAFLKMKKFDIKKLQKAFDEK